MWANLIDQNVLGRHYDLCNSRRINRKETNMAVSISFLGAARNVTGSRYLVQTSGKRILIDCGFYQERQFQDRNWDPFPVPANSIDAVLLTHAHLDHCGLIPKLVKEGFDGPIYCTPATAEIARIIMLDSAKIQQEDAEYKKKRHRREGREGKHPEEPLYKVADAEAAIPLLTHVGYEDPVDIVDGVTASYHEAGHILGSCMIYLTVEDEGEKKTILFSGDIGRKDRAILRNPETFEQADYVVIESTYGDRTHETSVDINDQLEKIVTETIAAGGNLIIPSFAVERAQELLYHFNELRIAKRIPQFMVAVDSPMAIRVTEVFKKHPELFDEETMELLRDGKHPCDFPGLTMTRSADESKALNRIRGTIAIIAGSGMCTGGRIKHHLANNIEREECTLLFVGYQAAGTLGRHITEGAETVRIHGQEKQVLARVARINGFSGHADQEGLLEWIKE